MYKVFGIFMVFLLVAGCDSAEFSANRSSELAAVDAVFQRVDENARSTGLTPLFSIDHSRLAEEAGEVLDASKVGFYSNPAVNSRILQASIRAGLDLPYRIQSYFQNGQQQVVYTDAEFIRTRHGIDQIEALAGFEQEMAGLISGISNARPVESRMLEKNTGIVELESEFGFDDSVARLKKAILDEGDTVWFHDIDYQQQAKAFEIDLPRSSLLVFGAPAPGATAMREYPSIGLDAFAQKVLVYQQDDRVRVIYNEIPGVARLHYDDTGIPHHVIAFRLKRTLSGAITGSD